MAQQRPRDPYAATALKIKQQIDDTYNTTYNESYHNLQTEKFSPLISQYYDKYQDVDYADDKSPYPLARDNVQPIYRKPYQLLKYPGTDREEPIIEDRRTRFEDSTLRRDRYMEPLPPRNYIDREGDFPKSDPHQDLQGYIQHEESPPDMRRQYRGQLADGPQQQDDDLKLVFCNKCFKSHCCMNKLACSHQYCDDCMANIPVQDRQFRDSIRWHYCCEICQKLTSDPKLVRVDPWGRRLLRYQDVKYFNTGSGST